MDAITSYPADAEAAPVKRAFPPLLPDPGMLWAIFRRRLWLFLAAWAVLALGVAWRTYRQVPQYAATSTVVITPARSDVVENVRPVTAPVQPDSAAIDTEVQVLSSPTLAGQVADSLHLERYPEFGGQAGALLQDTGEANDPGTHPLARNLVGHMHVERVGVSFVIAITATTSNPHLSALIANEYARQYIAQQAISKNSATHVVSGELQTRLDDMEKKVVAADAAVQGYKVSHNLMSSQGSTMAEQEVSSLSTQIASARADLADKEARLSTARAQLAHGGGGQDVGATLASGTVAALRQREADTTQRLADLTTRYGELYPDVQKTRQELADVRSQIQHEIDRIISSLSAERNAAASRLGSLQSSQAGARGELAGNNSSAVGLEELERKAEAARGIYQAFLNRSKETVSQEGLAQSDARIDALSRVPVLPVSPNIPLAVLLGLLGGSVFGLCSIAVAEYLDGKVRTKQDVEHKLRVRYLGGIPELRSTLGKLRNNQSPQDYLLDHPTSAFAEAFRGLRASLMQRGRQAPGTVAITSALPREGKSTTSICLARTMVSAGSRTLLLDCDLRRRSTSEMLLPENWSGLIDYITGAKSLADAVYEEPKSGLFVLGTTVPPDFGRDLFADRHIADVLDDVRSQFDVVILDTAPVLGIAETRAVAAACDVTLFLGRWRSTSIKAADAAIEMLLGAGAQLRGMAVTLVDIRRYASTGYQDTYSYQKKFKGYYQN